MHAQRILTIRLRDVIEAIDVYRVTGASGIWKATDAGIGSFVLHHAHIPQRERETIRDLLLRVRREVIWEALKNLLVLKELSEWGGEILDALPELAEKAQRLLGSGG